MQAHTWRLFVLILGVALLGCADRHAKKMFTSAVKSYKKEQYDDARISFLKLYRAGYSDTYSIQCMLASVYLQLQLYDSAKIFLDQALEHPDAKNDADLHANTAYYFWMNHLPNEAFQYINRAIELRPQEADLYMYRGLVYIDLYHTDKACADFRRAVKLGGKLTSISADALFKEENCESWSTDELEQIKRKFKPH
jgi:tetratricopeptide (TPR) repeat protein